MRRPCYTVGMPDGRVMVAEGGWCRMVVADPATEALVRVERADTGRLVAVELVVARLGGIVATRLRPLVPVAERWANGPLAEALTAALGARDALSDDEREALDARMRAEANLRANWGTDVAVLEAIPKAPRLGNLRVPPAPRQPKPDAFYRRVAEVYERASVLSPRPAQLVAEANGVPVSTVHGWTKESRRRGFLQPGARVRRQKQ